MKRKTGALAGLALVVGLLGGCGSGGSKTVTVTQSASVAESSTAASTTTGATGVTSSVSTPTAATAASSANTIRQTFTHIVYLSTFESPSRNIGCVVLDGTARCDINHRDWSPPPHPSSCPPVVDFGQGLEVYGSKPGTFVCAGDTAMDPSAPVLPYGSESVEGKFRCVSARTGMTCTNTATGHGFSISIQSYRLF